MDQTSQHLERGNLLLANGRIPDAMKEARNVLNLDPQNGDGLALMARCFIENGQLEEGMDCLREAIKYDPNESYYYYLMGYVEFKRDLNLSAISYLEKAIALYPYNAAYFGILSFALCDERKFEEALQKANEGLEIDPEDITCLNARARALNKLNRVEEAIETMKGSLGQDPDNEISHNNFGWNYLEKGRHKEAQHHFREALRIDPNFNSAREGLKESLKSSIPPYRWLLQLAFWLENKGASFRVFFAIGIYIAVQVIVRATSHADGFEKVGLVVLICYLVFATSTWIMGPLANAVLLFHKTGRYALFNHERWNAIGFLSAFGVGLGMLVFSLLPAAGDWSTPLSLAGLAAASLGIILGHIEIPVWFNYRSFLFWLNMALLLTATTGIILAIMLVPAYIVLLGCYMALFVIYTWVNRNPG